MNFTITVDVEVERTSGKFAAKQDVLDQIIEAIEGADPGQIDVDDTEYDVTIWEVTTS